MKLRIAHPRSHLRWIGRDKTSATIPPNPGTSNPEAVPADVLSATEHRLVNVEADEPEVLIQSEACQPEIQSERQLRKPTRFISKAVKDKVYARDGGRCTFIGSDGHRCGCTWDLEYDHVVAFS